MIPGQAQQGHREPVHVRVEHGVEAVQGRQRARRPRIVLRRHERPQHLVDVIRGVPLQHAPVVAGAGRAEGRDDAEEALGQDEAVFFVGRGQLRVVDAERTGEGGRSSVEVEGPAQAQGGVRRGGGGGRGAVSRSLAFDASFGGVLGGAVLPLWLLFASVFFLFALIRKKFGLRCA